MFTPNQNKFSNKGKILVAFYSQTGQTKKYAQIIAQKLEADIYEIIPVRKYNDDMWAAAAEADKEIKENRYPALKGSLPDISSYNTILIGSGVWTYTLANPVVSFVRAINFNKKKVNISYDLIILQNQVILPTPQRSVPDLWLFNPIQLLVVVLILYAYDFFPLVSGFEVSLNCFFGSVFEPDLW